MQVSAIPCLFVSLSLTLPWIYGSSVQPHEDNTHHRRRQLPAAREAMDGVGPVRCSLLFYATDRSRTESDYYCTRTRGTSAWT